jgi:hypothetical protein
MDSSKSMMSNSSPQNDKRIIKNTSVLDLSYEPQNPIKIILPSEVNSNTVKESKNLPENFNNTYLEELKSEN